MKGTLTLKNPILINNKTISEMTYDSNEITGALFSEAEAMRKRAAGMRNVSINPAIEFDFGLHLYLGYAAIIAVNPGYDFNDLERIHGGDLMTIMDIGRNFILQSEDSSPASSSDEPSGTTPKPSTPPSGNSNAGQLPIS